MINFIGTHGSSFKGLMAYLMHDIEADSSERVAWTHTRNLATEDPEKAWRIMVGTAKCQNELKAEAGIGSTGRKSHKHVFHYSLSWSREHDPDITPEEMIAAAEASMTYLGVYEGEKLGRDKKTGKMKLGKRTQFADEHQAIIVCHDEPDKNPHVHVVINRVHSQHGVMLPDNYEKEKLSAWALDYRKSQGKEHLCPQRVINAAKKAQGIVTSNPRKPRNVYDQEQALQDADPGSRRRAQLEQQIKQARALKTRHEAMKRRQAEQMHGLEDRHVAAERRERAKADDAIKARHADIKADYAPKFEALIERQASELEAFHEAKGTATGHVRNTWAAFKTKAWMNEIRTRPLAAMKHGFALAFSSGLQQRDIEKQHARELAALRGERSAEEREASRSLKTDLGFRLDGLRQGFHQDRSDLILKHDMDKAKMNTEWHQLGRDRLASRVEEVRGLDRDGRSGGGDAKKPRVEAEQQQGEATHDFEPANDNDYDIPIDELRDMARQIREEQLADDAQELDEDLDYDPDQEIDR